MIKESCAKCGAGLVPEASFCRSCGAQVGSFPESSEMPTVVLGGAKGAKTQRFEPRTTSEGDAAAVRAYRPAVPTQVPTRSRRGLMIVMLILVVLFGAVALTAIVNVVKRARLGAAKIQVSQQLNYPGSRTVVNLGSEGGGVLQMETTDRLDKVSDWYVATLKPSKSMRVNAATIILKDDKVTVTLAASDEGTSIVIKQLAP